MEHCRKCLNKAKLFMCNPPKAFKREQRTSPGDAFRYFLTLSVVVAVLGGITVGIATGSVITMVAGIVSIYVATLISAIVSGLILHIFAYLLGARKGLEQTMKTMLYAHTPFLLLGWIPFIGMIFWLWKAILNILGLIHLQKMSICKAILAVVIPLIIIWTLIVAAMLALFTAGTISSIMSFPFA